MEFSVKVSDVVAKLQLAAQATEKKTTIPILSHTLLAAKDGRAFITATDLELSIRTSCAAKVKKEGACTVPSAKLLSILLLLPDEEVRFKQLENKWVQITSDKKTYKLVGMASENFPTIPDAQGKGLKIPARTFVDLADKVSFAISNEESRYTLNGALMRIDGNVSFIATDGHRLAMANSAPLTEKAKDTTTLIPRKALSMVAAAAEDLPEDVQIEYSESGKHLFFDCAEWRITSRTLEGKFPNYEAVMPKEHVTRVTVGRAELTEALRRVGQMADYRSKAVKFLFRDTELEISAASPEFGEAKETLRLVGATAQKMEIGFNANYLLDFLSRTDSENIYIGLKDAQSAGDLRPVGDENYRYVVMPMRV